MGTQYKISPIFFLLLAAAPLGAQDTTKVAQKDAPPAIFAGWKLSKATV